MEPSKGALRISGDGPIEIPPDTLAKLNEEHVTQIFEVVGHRDRLAHEMKMRQLGMQAERDKSTRGLTSIGAVTLMTVAGVLLYRHDHATLERIAMPLITAIAGYIAGRARAQADR